MAKMLHDDIKKKLKGTSVGPSQGRVRRGRADIDTGAQDITGLRQVPVAEVPLTPPTPVNSSPIRPNQPAPTRQVNDSSQPPRVPISGRGQRLEPPIDSSRTMGPNGNTESYGYDNLGTTAAPPRYVNDYPSSTDLNHRDIASSIPDARREITSPRMPVDIGDLRQEIGQVRPAAPWPHGNRFMEAGVPGTGIFSGFISSSTTGEFNPNMFGWNGMRIYEQMRRTDADVAAALFAMKLPMFSVTPEIIPGESEGDMEGNLAKEIAEFVRENIMGGLERANPQLANTWVTQSFENVKENAFLMLDFGCSAHENLWRVDGNHIRLRYLAPRLPWTFYRFWTAEDGETLTGLEQLGYRRERYVSTTIPANNVCLFTNRMEGANFFGISALRSAYLHWYIKSNLYRIDSMALEKNGMGVPFIKFPPGAKSEDIAAAQQWVEQMAVSERTGLSLPDGYEFEIAGLKGRLRDPINSIKHHSQEIVRSVMAMFIALGTTETGSRALANTLLDLFRQSLQHYATVFCSQFNNSTIKPLVDLNYSPKNGHRLPYPKLEFPSIVVIDPVETANVLQKLGASQVDIIRSSVPLEKAVLQKFGLPYGPARTKFAPTVTQVRIMAQPSGEETVQDIETSRAPVEEAKGPSSDTPTPNQKPAQPKGDEIHTKGSPTDVHDFINTVVAGRHGTAAVEKGKTPPPRKYKLSDMREFQGIPVFVETDKGEIRSGVDSDGSGWSIEMSRPYGYIKGVLGLDQDELDCFIGPYRKAKNVYIIRTRDPQRGTVDEEKVMMGFRNSSEAKNTFLKNYTSPDFFRSIRSMPLSQFKKWMDIMRVRMTDQPGGREPHSPEIGMDLDGTLAKHILPFNPDMVGPPIESGIEKVKKLQSMGYRVFIFTAREDLRPVIRWSLDMGLNLPVTNKKRKEFIAIIDDRAIPANDSVESTIHQVTTLNGGNK